LIYWPSLQSLAPTSPGRLAFSYTIAVDPRIRVRAVTPGRFSGFTDDRGNNLAVVIEVERLTAPDQGNVWPQNLVLEEPQDVGSKIPSLKGKVTLVVELPEKKAGEEPGTREVTIPFEFTDLPLPKSP
jgi:hypothetical protein